MKRLTKLKVKYFLIVSCVLMIFGIILPTFMRYHTFVTANVVGNAKETRSSTYKIKFHSNGGSGDMQEMTIKYNEPHNLTKNIFILENYNFGGWNTESDGTGINYEDEQEINQTAYLDGDEINLYARWIQGTAVIGNTSYDTLQAAIDAVSADNTETTIKLLKNVSEVITVAKDKKIIFDFQNFTVSNKGENPVVSNFGNITIQNGTITSSTKQGAINNKSGALLTMTGGNIIATGIRQAIYNDGGTVEITGDAYLSAVSTERATVQNNTNTSKLYITGGKIISTNFCAVKNAGVMNIGVKDSNVDINSPCIQGATYGVTSTTNFNFYDGIIKGIANNAIENETKVREKEPGYAIEHTTETIDNVTYNIVFLTPTTSATITFDANEGTVSETTRIVTTRRNYWYITSS